MLEVGERRVGCHRLELEWLVKEWAVLEVGEIRVGCHRLELEWAMMILL